MSQLEEMKEKINKLKRKKIEERDKIDEEINSIKKQIAELNPKEIPFSRYCSEKFGKWMGGVPQAISEICKFACFGKAAGNPRIREMNEDQTKKFYKVADEIIEIVKKYQEI